MTKTTYFCETKITHFCDHCGKEMKRDEYGQYKGLIDVKFDFPSTHFDATLCEDCYNELLTLVDEFLRGDVEDGRKEM